MKVGIISKEAHAKSHASALAKAGFCTVMLGSSPSEIPPTVPLVVVRPLSCSHTGMDTALAWARAMKGRLIVENGVKNIVDKAMQARLEGQARQVRTGGRVQVPVPPRVAAPAALPALTPAVEVIETPVKPVEVIETPVKPVQGAKKPVAPVYPARFANRVDEADAHARMEKAWEVRGGMTDAEAQALGEWANKGAPGAAPCPEHLYKLNKNPIGFAGLLILCSDIPLSQRDIIRAYAFSAKKNYFGLMAEIAAWALGATLNPRPTHIPRNPGSKNGPKNGSKNGPKNGPKNGVAEAVPPVEAPVVPAPVVPAPVVPAPVVPAPADLVEPPPVVPTPTHLEVEAMPNNPTPTPVNEEATLTMLKALCVSLDTLLLKVETLDQRVGVLAKHVEDMAYFSTPDGGTEKALVGLAHKGLEVVVRTSSVR